MFASDAWDLRCSLERRLPKTVPGLQLVESERFIATWSSTTARVNGVSRVIIIGLGTIGKALYGRLSPSKHIVQGADKDWAALDLSGGDAFTVLACPRDANSLISVLDQCYTRELRTVCSLVTMSTREV